MELVAVGQVGLRGSGLAVVGRIVAIRLEQVQVEEVLSIGVAAGMGEADDMLLDVFVVGRFGEFGAETVADGGIAPGGGSRGGGGKYQGQTGVTLPKT